MPAIAPAQLWTAELATAADRHTIDVLGMPSPVLMERAALCVCAEIESLADRCLASSVLILVGPGNNGGDGLAIARVLHGRGRVVRAVLVGARHNESVTRQLALARAHGVEIGERLPERPSEPTIVVDALLGTGSRGAPRGAIADALAWLAALERAHVGVVAVDLPSGVDVDTGAVLGAAATADVTVTFQRSKPGLHVTPAREHVGQLVVADIGLLAPDGIEPSLTLIDPREVASQLAGLPSATHKNRRGHVGVIGGTGGTPGAAILAATAALRTGAGLVTLAPLDPELRELLIARRPELMLAAPEHAWTIPSADVLVIGPGLVIDDSQAGKALARLRQEDPRSMIWDAGGLDHYERSPMSARHVLTPHPGEAARMLARLDPDRSWDAAAVQANRRAAAERLATATAAIVVLKGAGTLVAMDGPDGRGLAICTTGGLALAAAGTGDVLAGTIGALLGRGLDPWVAACVGVHVHGLAGDRLPEHGTLALEVADSLVPAFEQADRVPLRWPGHVRG
jgi:NAD(P)H-hydrate epimerase